MVSVGKAPAKSKARDAPFQPEPEVEYSLNVVFQDANGVVESFQCHFCSFQGQKEVSGAEGKHTQETKIFAPPYRTENYQFEYKRPTGGK
uniref:Uncharacterized protein n=1 Tax=Peronospora matthiolae TaxID=2874970 RepID=A0AAV1V1S4_9STRA